MQIERDPIISGVYIIRNNINGKVYIGLSQDVYKRIKSHFSHNKVKEKDNKLYKDMLKFGKNNFTWDIIEEVNVNELLRRESYWIKYYNSVLNGYNRAYTEKPNNTQYYYTPGEWIRQGRTIKPCI